jgi:hypothetical protein
MRVLNRPRPTYDDDYYLWALDQAERLRGLAELRANEPLDWELLAEEIEELARSDRRACASYVEQIVAHMLKLAYSAQDGPRGHWRGEIAAFRSDLRKTLTRAIEAKLRSELAGLYDDARKRAVERLAEEEPGFSDRIPGECPYGWEQVTGDWLPDRARVD